MNKSLKKILRTIVLSSLVILIGCKPQNQEVSLQDKIAIAVKSRKVPCPEEQKVSFTTPDWVLGRGPQSTEIFSHLENYVPSILIKRGTTGPITLAKNLSTTLGGQKLCSPYYTSTITLDQISEQKKIDGIIVLHKGEIVYEKYPDMEATDRHLIASVSKSFVGTVIAQLADEGKLNEQDPIGKHLEEFKNKPLENVSIELFLRMASGINCREHEKNLVSFTDPEHCFYKLLQHTALYPGPETGTKKSLMGLLADAGKFETAGRTYDYTSVNSIILSTIAERISGKPYHELVSEYIWSKIGAEDDARIAFSSSGMAASYGGMMMRLRDLARYGLAFTDDAKIKIASKRYLSQLRMGDKELFRSAGGLGQRLWLTEFKGQNPAFQSYHWDVVFNDGDFSKFGHGGQGLYVSPEKRLVIAFFSSNKNATQENNIMRWLVRSLALLGQFN